MSDVKLTVNGRLYEGWKEIEVDRGIDTLAGAFTLPVSERWNGQTEPWPILPEDECSLSLAGTTMVTGWIDELKLAKASGKHDLSIAGRDKAGALVDNSVEIDAGEFINIPILELCNKVAKPFGITIALQDGISDGAISLSSSTSKGQVRGGGSPTPGTAGKSSSMRIGTPTAKATIQDGDSPFDVIARACKLAGLIPVSDGLGGVLLTRAGGARTSTALVEGENILEWEYSHNVTGAFRRYVVLGQAQGDEETFGAQAASIKGTAQDPNVRRADRVLRVRAEGSISLTPQFAKQRAGWQAATAAARTKGLSVTVQGWQQGNGAVWPANAVVPVTIPSANIKSDWLIVHTKFTLNEQSGTRTVFTLVPSDALTPEPVVAAVKSSGPVIPELQ